MSGLFDFAELTAKAAKTLSKLSVELETLQTFKKRVDGLLTELEESKAAPKEVKRERIQAAHLGTGFGEAESLMSAYHTVHGHLDLLSQTLADQIEAMSLTVQMAHNDYHNVDEEQRERLWEIWQMTKQRYQAAKEHDKAGQREAGGSQPQPDESTAGGSL